MLGGWLADCASQKPCDYKSEYIDTDKPRLLRLEQGVVERAAKQEIGI